MKKNELTKQLVGCHKAAFETGYDTAVLLQEHTSKAVDQFLKKAPWFPVQAKSIIKEWNGVYRNGAVTFKEIADQSYAKLEDALESGFEAFKLKS